MLCNLTPVINSSHDEIVEITLELNSERELEPEKEKPIAAIAARSRCLRSTAPGELRRRRGRRSAGFGRRT